MSGNPYSPPAAEVADIEPGRPSLDRPPLVALGVRLLWASIAVGIAQFVTDSFELLNNPEGVDVAEFLLGVAISLVILGVVALMTWYAWKGRNWARVVHLVWLIFSLVVTLVMIVALRSVMAKMGGEVPELIDIWFVSQTGLSAIGVIFLFTPGANAWYRAMKAARAA